ncbi:hypothetical protein HDU76_003264, partial [Blyttiomyces sp. JEL0837]
MTSLKRTLPSDLVPGDAQKENLIEHPIEENNVAPSTTTTTNKPNQPLPDYDDDLHRPMKWNCDQIRRKINAFLALKTMTQA